MLNKERHYAILTYLNRYERATVSHLAKIFWRHPRNYSQ